MKRLTNKELYLDSINYKTIEIKEIIFFLDFIMLNRLSSYNISLNNNTEIVIRDKNHFNNYWDNIYLENDIFFIKLYKIWLLNIELFNIKLNINTEKWKSTYRFLDKYLLKSDEYTNSETWNVKYDIHKIVNNEEEYEKFIQHIFSNIFYDDYEIIEDIEIYLENNVEMKVIIPDLKIFFEKISKIFIKKNTLEYLKNKLILEYKNDNVHIEFPKFNYFKSYTSIYFLLKHLEKKWLLIIKDIIYYNKIIDKTKWIWKTFIKFEIEKIVNEISPIFFEWFELNKVNQYRTEYKEKAFYIDGKKYRNYKNNKISSLIKIIFEYRKKSNKSEFTYIELLEYFKKNENEYNYFYNKININNQYENIKKLKKDEINDFLLKKIFNKEYFKWSLWYENKNKNIFIYKVNTTWLLI